MDESNVTRMISNDSSYAHVYMPRTGSNVQSNVNKGNH
jgi:hypothetical protein